MAGLGDGPIRIHASSDFDHGSVKKWGVELTLFVAAPNHNGTVRFQGNGMMVSSIHGSEVIVAWGIADNAVIIPSPSHEPAICAQGDSKIVASVGIRHSEASGNNGGGDVVASSAFAAPHDDAAVLADGPGESAIPVVYPDIHKVVAWRSGLAVAVVATTIVNGAVLTHPHGEAIPTVEGGHGFVEGVVEGGAIIVSPRLGGAVFEKGDEGTFRVGDFDVDHSAGELRDGKGVVSGSAEDPDFAILGENGRVVLGAGDVGDDGEGDGGGVDGASAEVGAGGVLVLAGHHEVGDAVAVEVADGEAVGLGEFRVDEAGRAKGGATFVFDPHDRIGVVGRVDDVEVTVAVDVVVADLAGTAGVEAGNQLFFAEFDGIGHLGKLLGGQGKRGYNAQKEEGCAWHVHEHQRLQ